MEKKKLICEQSKKLFLLRKQLQSLNIGEKNVKEIENSRWFKLLKSVWKNSTVLTFKSVFHFPPMVLEKVYFDSLAPKFFLPISFFFFFLFSVLYIVQKMFYTQF